jgi:hypothetical protein
MIWASEERGCCPVLAQTLIAVAIALVAIWLPRAIVLRVMRMREHRRTPTASRFLYPSGPAADL